LSAFQHFGLGSLLPCACEPFPRIDYPPAVHDLPD
jgi:hypothetical protein